MTWWQYGLIIWGIITVISLIAEIFMFKNAIDVPQDIDIFDL